MANTLDELSALAIKTAGIGKHFDGGDLFLDVKKSGARYWRLKYRYGTREGLLAFGTYPSLGGGQRGPRQKVSYPNRASAELAHVTFLASAFRD